MRDENAGPPRHIGHDLISQLPPAVEAMPRQSFLTSRNVARSILSCIGPIIGHTSATIGGLTG